VTASARAFDPVALVPLKGGLVVPLDALLLAWSLEDRGATFALDGDELIVDTPQAAVLTNEDRMAIRRWRAHLIAIITYCPLDRAS
jgi:hypothetical protein